MQMLQWLKSTVGGTIRRIMRGRAEAERAARDSDGWSTFHAQALPAGMVQIRSTPGRTPVRLAIDNPEQPEVSYVVAGVDYEVRLRSPETFMFQVQDEGSDPRTPTVWTAEIENPDAEPNPAGGLVATWRFGDAGEVSFEYAFDSRPAYRHPIRCEEDPQPFARGFCGIAHYTDTESWVRGKAVLDAETGALHMWLQLETDSVGEGPEGHIDVSLWDADNVKLYEVRIGPVAIGGKEPGLSRIETISANATVAQPLAARTSSVRVAAQRTGLRFGPFGFDLLGKFTDNIEVTYTAHT